jgi:hypothetical protein
MIGQDERMSILNNLDVSSGCGILELFGKLAYPLQGVITPKVAGGQYSYAKSAEVSALQDGLRDIVGSEFSQ